ncbi:MAG: hypothetical protein COZ11_02380 [Deltaproteobacteria bacterium CG_4_10_14_3_um_filter_51_14]|nr:MAG: hypothetical protein COZ11_02380 [Deltaproteobacteria bacterium CG_4_10_14_3_um_filter_51_14]PJB33887.1 MAG: hypothetical protein CO107_14605 [Deltaproteobacteria bacterium CG_4_9_14_3_um_filter_51_14]
MPRDFCKVRKNGKKKEGLTPLQEKAIVALMTTANVRDAAKEVNVSPRSIFIWLNDPAFEKAYREVRSRTVGFALAELQKAMAEAVATLRDVMRNAEALPSARVSAARCILELGQKWTETEDILARVSALEEKIENRKEIDNEAG